MVCESPLERKYGENNGPFSYTWLKQKNQTKQTKPSKNTNQETDRTTETFPFEKRLGVCRTYSVDRDAKVRRY